MRVAIGAIVNHDGGPVEPGELDRLCARAHLPWGGSPRRWFGDGCALLSIPAFERAPPRAVTAARDGDGAAAGDDRYAVVVDGSLDNGAELARELGLQEESAAPGNEAHLIAVACERWGDASAARLIGEFAFLAWDRRQRRLLAGRDAFGLRELFYTDGGRQFSAASQLQMLIARPGLSDLDVEYVADFLACLASRGPATPFKTVRRLQPGHRLTLAAGQVETRCVWEPADLALPRHETDKDYVDHFLALFQEAVEHCLASGQRVWAELSGGLDSSSITCVAQETMQRDPTLDRDFATMSWVWKDTPQSDERQWSDKVVEKYHIPNHQVWCDDLFFDGAHEESRCRNEPHFGIFCHPMARAQAELLRASGVEVLLTGSRAEGVVLANTPAPVHLADMVRRRDLGPFLHQLLAWQRGTHQPLANLLFAFVLQPLLGRRRYLRSRDDRGILDPWVDKEFAHRMQLRDRMRDAIAKKRFHSIAQQLQYEHLLRSDQMMVRGLMEWAVEIRHPFLYRPLVELALAIPWEQKVSPREYKLLLRRGLDGRLPEEVRTRTTGSGFGPAAYKAYAKRWASIEPVVRSSLLVSMGFVDAAELRRAAELARFGASPGFAAFLTCLSFEYWLRSILGHEAERPSRAAA